MKWTIDRSRLPSFVRLDTSGEPDVSDLRAMWNEVITSDFWKPGFTVLLDNRKLSEAKDPGKYIEDAINIFVENNELLGPACIAAVGTQSVSFMHARQFQYGIRLKGSDAVLQLFNSEQQAIRWLNHFCQLRERSK